MKITTVKDNKKLSKKELEELIIDSINDIKGKDIVFLDLSELEESPADLFVVCTGSSTTQVKSIAENLQFRLKMEGNLRASHIEGAKTSLWVLLDYFDLVIHVFLPETREFYDIESLWSDAKIVKYSSESQVNE